MIIRSSLFTYPNMRAELTALTDLELSYLKANKHKNTVSLTLTSTSRPIYDERGRMKLSNEIIEVRAVYDGAVPTQVSEYEWFKSATQST